MRQIKMTAPIQMLMYPVAHPLQWVVMILIKPPQRKNWQNFHLNIKLNNLCILIIYIYDHCILFIFALSFNTMCMIQ